MASAEERGPGSTAPGAGKIAAGAVLGAHYRVVRQLARGSMTDVHEVEHVELGKRCVAKVPRHPFSADPRLGKALLNEGRALAALKHPSIVEVLDFGTDPKHGAFLILELLEGETLAVLLKRQESMAVARALPLIEGLLEALGTVHAAGIVHRNISPEALFLTHDGDGKERLKLLDFGFARSAEPAMDEVTEVNPFAVTVPYVSLEQLKNGNSVDARTDVYSVAAVLFAILTGAPPHMGLKLRERLERGAALASPLLSSKRPETPGWLDAALARALTQLAVDRFTSCKELRAALRAGRGISDSFTDETQTLVELAPGPFPDQPAPAAIAEPSVVVDEAVTLVRDEVPLGSTTALDEASNLAVTAPRGLAAMRATTAPTAEAPSPPKDEPPEELGGPTISTAAYDPPQQKTPTPQHSRAPWAIAALLLVAVSICGTVFLASRTRQHASGTPSAATPPVRASLPATPAPDEPVAAAPPPSVAGATTAPPQPTGLAAPAAATTPTEAPRAAASTSPDTPARLAPAPPPPEDDTPTAPSNRSTPPSQHPGARPEHPRGEATSRKGPRQRPAAPASARGARDSTLFGGDDL